MPFASDGVVHNFGPTSKLRDIPLKANAEVIELDHKATGDTEGLKVVLTKAAHFAFTEVCQVTVEEKLAKFEKKMKTEAAEQLKANMIKASPIKFIDKFAFNEKSFLAKPTTEKGMAMARSGMQHVATRRVQLLGLDKDKEELKEAILRVVPIHFEREFWAKSKNNLETYSKLAHQKLNECIKEFEVKKADKHFKTLLGPIRSIVEASATESFSMKG